MTYKKQAECCVIVGLLGVLVALFALHWIAGLLALSFFLAYHGARILGSKDYL